MARTCASNFPMKPLLLLLFALFCSVALGTEIFLQKAPIIVDPAAIASEWKAAYLLAQGLGYGTGTNFLKPTYGTKVPDMAVLVGPGAEARRIFKDVPFDKLADERI